MKRGYPPGSPDTKDLLKFMNSTVEKEVYQKQRRRQAEYCGLVAFQTVIVWAVHEYLRYDTSAIVGFGAFMLAWILARFREQRRTLNVVSRSRILIDALESLLLMFLLAIGAILSLKAGVDLLVLQAHFSVFFAMYFLGTWLGEVHWRKQNLNLLSLTGILNYKLNLNKSVIFPYNTSFLRSLFRK